tara:strand:- start:3228 stop:3572 length:345 start_codon:yes stop_codon:yes gene_type:complete
LPRTEYDECVALVKYMDLLQQTGIPIVYSHIAQSTWTPSFKQKSRNKAMGVRQGVPDYLVLINGKTLFIEMKREKGGVVSKYQKDWIEKLNASGVKAVVCRGFDQAKEVIDALA